MIKHPDDYKKEYYKFIEEMEERFGISKVDPMYEDRLDEAFNAMSDDLMADLSSATPLS